jgi:two-component system LytT family response regulator
MLKTIIIDDEQHCIDAILKLTSEYNGFFDIIGTYKNVEKAIKATKAHKPDLVFLDVEINDYTAFDYLEQIGDFNFFLVFTTAYSKYAVDAFKFSALHYLLKPIDIDDFNEVVDRLKNGNSIQNLNKKIDILLHNNEVKNQEKKIIIDTSQEGDIINVSEILYCLSNGNYTEIYIVDKNKKVSSKTLKIYEDMLSGFEFYRADQQALVNISHIKKYTKGKPTYVIMSDGKKIKVSTYKRQGLIESLRSKY